LTDHNTDDLSVHVERICCVVHQGEGRRTLRCIDVKGRQVAACVALDPCGAVHVSRAFKALSALQQRDVRGVPRVAFYVDKPLPVLATYWIDGVSLWHLVMSQGPVDSSTALRWYSVLKNSLASTHDCGLAHNDVTPPNIVIGKDTVHLIDFGLADDISSVRSTAHALFRKRRRVSVMLGVDNDMEMLQMALSFAVLGLAEYARRHKMGTLPMNLFK
jgi:serine/threonine protein kinase